MFHYSLHNEYFDTSIVELRKRIHLGVKFLRIILQSVVNDNFQYGILYNNSRELRFSNRGRAS